MIKISEIKKGALIWWKRNPDRFSMGWDCPVIVTEVTKKGFQVKSLDDFKLSPELSMNDGQKFMIPTSRNEMRPCSFTEVKEYFKNNLRDKNQEASDREQAIQNAQKALAEYKESITQYENEAVSFLAEIVQRD